MPSGIDGVEPVRQIVSHQFQFPQCNLQLRALLRIACRESNGSASRTLVRKIRSTDGMLQCPVSNFSTSDKRWCGSRRTALPKRLNGRSRTIKRSIVVIQRLLCDVTTSIFRIITGLPVVVMRYLWPSFPQELYQVIGRSDSWQCSRSCLMLHRHVWGLPKCKEMICQTFANGVPELRSRQVI